MEATTTAVDPKSLADEDRNNTNKQKRPAQTNSEWLAGSQSLNSDLPVGLLRSDFEKALKDAYYGTFMFYQKLTEEQRAKIYQTYQQQPAIDILRNQIISMQKGN